MKRFAIFFLVLGLSSWASAFPKKITYQGNLRDKGLPVTGTKTMTFELLNKANNSSIWSTTLPVPVKQGLFSVILDVTGVDFEHLDTSLRLTVEGQPMGPLPEELTANAYSLVANTVVDGGISRQKLDTSTQDKLIPPGMIAMFMTNACPAGWSPATVLNNRFPYGFDPASVAGPNNPAPGTQGGTAQHSHTIAPVPDHSHGGFTGPSINDRHDGKVGGPDTEPTAGHTHVISPAGGHDHGGATGTVTLLPPYAAVTFCQKQ